MTSIKIKIQKKNSPKKNNIFSILRQCYDFYIYFQTYTTKYLVRYTRSQVVTLRPALEYDGSLFSAD